MRTRTVFALATLAAAAFAGQGVMLRWTPKEGDELKYQTVGKFEVGGISAEMTSVNIHKVIRVDPDGSFLVEAKPIDGKVVYNGTELPSKGATIQTVYAAGGELKEIRGDKPDTTGYRMANLSNFHAPTKAVMVGDTWTAEGKADAKTGAVAWKADYKVLGEETIGPYTALKMDVNARETDGTDGAKATGNIWVGKNGVLVRSELKWSNMVVPGAPAPVNATLTMTLQP